MSGGPRRAAVRLAGRGARLAVRSGVASARRGGSRLRERTGPLPGWRDGLDGAPPPHLLIGHDVAGVGHFADVDPLRPGRPPSGGTVLGTLLWGAVVGTHLWRRRDRLSIDGSR